MFSGSGWHIPGGGGLTLVLSWLMSGGGSRPLGGGGVKQRSSQA